MKYRIKKRVKKHVCFLCGKSGVTEIHHIYNGPFRARSDINDFVMEVCPKCHREIHESDLCGQIKVSFQKSWERTHSHEEWMRVMGRSWA